MNDPATRLLHVDAFRGGIGRQEQTNRSSGVLELGLDCLELVKVHAAVEQSERVLVEPFLKQTLLQVEQCLLVLGEHDQPLVSRSLPPTKRFFLTQRTRASVLESDFLARDANLAASSMFLRS